MFFGTGRCRLGQCKAIVTCCGGTTRAFFGCKWGEWKMSLASRKKSMTWIAIFLMMAAMAMYVLSDDESLPPQELEERTGAVVLGLGRV